MYLEVLVRATRTGENSGMDHESETVRHKQYGDIVVLVTATSRIPSCLERVSVVCDTVPGRTIVSHVVDYFLVEILARRWRL